MFYACQYVDKICNDVLSFEKPLIKSVILIKLGIFVM
jgi:hypothetical protein